MAKKKTVSKKKKKEQKTSDLEQELAETKGKHAQTRQDLFRLNEEFEALRLAFSQLKTEKNEIAEQAETQRINFLEAQQTFSIEKQCEIDKLKHECQVNKAKIIKLTSELGGYGILHDENKKQRDRIEILENQLHSLFEESALEKHRHKTEINKLQLQLGGIFRHQLKKLDIQYQERAFEDLDDESRNALIAKRQLNQELLLQSKGVDALTKAYESQKKELIQARLDNQIMLDIQQKNNETIATLKKQLVLCKRRALQSQDNMLIMKQSFHRASKDSASASEYQNMLEELQLELEETKQMLKAETEQKIFWKQRARENETISRPQTAGTNISAQSQTNRKEFISSLMRFGSRTRMETKVGENSNQNDEWVPGKSNLKSSKSTPVLQVNVEEKKNSNFLGIFSSMYENKRSVKVRPSTEPSSMKFSLGETSNLITRETAKTNALVNKNRDYFTNASSGNTKKKKVGVTRTSSKPKITIHTSFTNGKPKEICIGSFAGKISGKTLRTKE